MGKMNAMSSAPKPNPAAYPMMRSHALKLRLPNVADGDLHVVTMDWRVLDGEATITALAAADGTGSIYLSSGGGFIGGAKRFPRIREAALLAIHVATGLLSRFEFTEKTEIPPVGEIYFYVTTNAGIRLAIAKETDLNDGTDPLLALHVTMRQIVTFYRFASPVPQERR
jgi:hypothetical protein